MILPIAVFALCLAVQETMEAGESPIAFARREIATARKYSHASVSQNVRFRLAPNHGDRGNELYQIERGDEENEILVTGGNDRGMMYGGIDIAEAIAAGRDPFELVGPVHRPFLQHRQFKLNLPLAGSAYVSAEAIQHNSWFWDENYWDSFLDLLARSRFNTLSLWSAHPYPQMLTLSKYPEVKDISDEQLAKNIKLFHSIFQKAKARGIDIYLITWNVHLSPTFAKAHQLADSGVDTPLVREYQKECVRGLLKEYPEIKGVGTCPGEAMPQDARGREEFIRDTYLAGIEASGRSDVEFLQRYWFASPGPTEEIVAKNCKVPMYVSIKYNGEHMYSSPKPHFFDKQWIEQKPRDYSIIWHLRNDDLFTLRWGDPEFVRSTVRNMAVDGAGFLTGSEIWIDGADYIHTDEAAKHVSWKYDFERHWLRYMLWGRIGYDPELSARTIEDWFSARFGRGLGPDLSKAMEAASRLYPKLTSFHWQYMNGDWYPEGCVGSWVTDDTFMNGKPLRLNNTIFHDVLEFIFCHTIDPELMSIPEYVGYRLNNKKIEPGRKSPFDVADEIYADAAAAERELAAHHSDGVFGEIACTVLDLRTQVALARYYSFKIRGATHLALHMAGFDGEQQKAKEGLTFASKFWVEVASIGDAHYREHEVWLMGKFSWGRYQNDVDHDIEIASACKPDPQGVRDSEIFKIPENKHLDYNLATGDLSLGIAPFLSPPPLAIDGGLQMIEAEDFAGPWREQTNYPGFTGRGFRTAAVLGSVATNSIRRRIDIKTEATYTFWVRGLIGHAQDGGMDRSVQLAVDGKLLQATQTELTTRPRFTWENAGALALAPGIHEIKIQDHGAGFEHVDCVAISNDPNASPAGIADLGHVLDGGPARFENAIVTLLNDAPTPEIPKDKISLEKAQSRMRAELARAIGLDPARPRTPLNARTTGTIDRGDFVVEKLIFESRPNYYVTAHLYKPKGAGPFPGVLVPVGHWIQDAKMTKPMQELGQAFARRGFAALIYDPVGQGERAVNGNSHRFTLQLFLAGETDLTYMLFDSMRAMDLLASRPDIDSKRLAVTGCSGGGLNTIYFTALDPRQSAAAASCYVTTFRALLEAGNHCEDNYIPGVRNIGDLGDIYALGWPRKIVALAADRDSINPVFATQTSFARAKKWYEGLGAAEDADLFIDHSEHDYSKGMRERAAALFDSALNHHKNAKITPESWTPELAPWDSNEYKCFENGMPADGLTLKQLAAAAIARKIDEREKSPLPVEEIRKQLKDILKFETADPRVRTVKEGDEGGIHYEKFVLESPGGFEAPCVLLKSDKLKSGTRAAAAIIVDDAGKAGILDNSLSQWRRRIDKGEILLFIDVRGKGECASDEEHAWRVATMIGRPLLGMRASDIAAAARILKKHGDVDPGKISIETRGIESGLAGLFAGVCEGIVVSKMEGGLKSYRGSTEFGWDTPSIFVPHLLDVGDISQIELAAKH
ncbi:MAG: acetylxylan esterase [Planctomycetes bacterium]|nr:acetylxylan esterase [Planctomycetota bacterium]